MLDATFFVNLAIFVYNLYNHYYLFVIFVVLFPVLFRWGQVLNKLCHLFYLLWHNLNPFIDLTSSYSRQLECSVVGYLSKRYLWIHNLYCFISQNSCDVRRIVYKRTKCTNLNDKLHLTLNRPIIIDYWINLSKYFVNVLILTELPIYFNSTNTC